jgi:hypothetical protein
LLLVKENRMAVQTSPRQVTCPACGCTVPVVLELPVNPSACPACRRPLSSREVLQQSRWYYTFGGKKVGPVSWTQLHRQASGGHLRSADMILLDGAAKWVSAGSLPDLFQAGNAPGDPTAVEFMLDPTAEPSPPRPQHRRRGPVQILPWDRQFLWYSVGLAAGALAIALWILFAT